MDVEVNQNQPGLLNNGEPVFLAVAKIFKPHGLKGEVSAEMLSDFTDRLIKGKQVYIGEEHLPIRINSIRKTNKKYLISFLDHPEIENVEKFRNKMIYIKETEFPMLTGEEYYYHDLLGIEVYSEENESIGVLADILRTGANDVYVVQPHDKQKEEILLPAIKAVIKNVDIKARKMIVKLQVWR
ncbi:MAG: ribosome maturation factor RimM [Pelolinea sp.]|nr:ribosome maturation factor RimM [Pelolinea sp.]